MMQECVTSQRLNTAALKPNDDWAGVFIRGDEAVAYAQLLHHVNKSEKCDGLRELERLLLSAWGPKA